MSGGNPFVAEVQGPSWHAGTFLIDDVMSLSEDIASGNWLAAGMDAVAGVIDTVATVSDPLGSAIAAGIGFILEHLEPLKGWLNDLTGDPYQVQATAGTYAKVAKGLADEADVLNRSVAKDFADQSGQLVDAYVARMTEISNGLIALSRSANAASGALGIAGTIVQVVHDMVRDAISEIIGSAISYAAELVLTLGAATPLVIEQVSTRVASISARIGKNVTGVITSARNLGDLVKRLEDALKSLGDQFKKLGSPGHGGPSGPTGRPDGPTPSRRPGQDPHDELTDVQKSDLQNRRDDLAAQDPDRFDDLSKDPDHGGKSNKNSRDEAATIMDLDGRPGSPFENGITRPDGPAQGDFISDGQAWDIKTVHSDWPPGVPDHVRERPFPNGYTDQKFSDTVQDQIDRGRNVLIDTRNASQADLDSMRRMVEEKGWSGNVYWYP
ncbi:hypothetical protein ABTZ46_26665 [Nocardioides sp. NPDC126508]